MDRFRFYKEVTVDGVKELDFLWNNLSSFEIKRTPIYYRTTVSDVMQPDFISYKIYGTERYWWIICLVNDIMNPFTDIEEGVILKIPHIMDIYDFLKKWRMR